MEGAKNAAVTISSMLQQSDWKELRGLLNRDALMLKYILEKIFLYFTPFYPLVGSKISILTPSV